MEKLDKIKNIFKMNENYDDVIMNSSFVNGELFETISNGDGKFKVERIISTGQVTPENEVYDQDVDELVFLIQGKARLLFVDENREVNMLNGDYVYIKAHNKHRVTYTSKEPPCIWIAIHGTMNMCSI